MAVQIGDRARAARYDPLLLPFAGRLANFQIDRVLGALAILLGDWRGAETHLAAAEAKARGDGLRPDIARALAARADLELARGGRGSGERARILLDEALAILDQIGWASEAQILRERHARVARAAAPAPTTVLPAGLSEREAEVLRLVAAGRSNRQIA